MEKKKLKSFRKGASVASGKSLRSIKAKFKRFLSDYHDDDDRTSSISSDSDSGKKKEIHPTSRSKESTSSSSSSDSGKKGKKTKNKISSLSRLKKKKSTSSSSSSDSGKKSPSKLSKVSSSSASASPKMKTALTLPKKRLQFHLQQDRDEAKFLPDEETPSSSPSSSNPRHSSGTKQDQLGRAWKTSSEPTSPADLAHNFNLNYRGGASSPIALLHSLSQKEPGRYGSLLSELSLASASSSNLDFELLDGNLDDMSSSSSKTTALKPTIVRSAQQDEEQGVWKCRRCGWVYPKSRPSASDRRQHKKHCGEISNVHKWLGGVAPPGDGDIGVTGGDVQELHADLEVLKASNSFENVDAAAELPMDRLDDNGDGTGVESNLSTETFVDYPGTGLQGSDLRIGDMMHNKEVVDSAKATSAREGSPVPSEMEVLESQPDRETEGRTRSGQRDRSRKDEESGKNGCDSLEDGSLSTIVDENGVGALTQDGVEDTQNVRIENWAKQVDDARLEEMDHSQPKKRENRQSFLSVRGNGRFQGHAAELESSCNQGDAGVQAGGNGSTEKDQTVQENIKQSIGPDESEELMEETEPSFTAARHKKAELEEDVEPIFNNFEESKADAIDVGAGSASNYLSSQDGRDAALEPEGVVEDRNGIETPGLTGNRLESDIAPSSISSSLKNPSSTGEEDNSHGPYFDERREVTDSVQPLQTSSEDLQDEEGTSRMRNITVITSSSEQEEDISVKFSSVQKYWADVTRSEYLLIEGKRSPSFKKGADTASPSDETVEAKISPSPFSRSKIDSEDVRNSSPLAPISYSRGLAGKDGEITSEAQVQHVMRSLNSHPMQYDFEQVVREQKTHDLVCPVCGSCVTERVILRKRKRTVLAEGDARLAILRDGGSGEEEKVPLETPTDDSEDETWGCLACLAFFIRRDKGVGRSGKGLESGAEGQPISLLLPSEEDQRDSSPCLPLFPSFRWGLQEAEPALLEPLLRRSLRKAEPTEPAPVAQGRIHEVPLDDDDEEVNCFSYLQSIRKQRVSRGSTPLPESSGEPEQASATSLVEGNDTDAVEASSVPLIRSSTPAELSKKQTPSKKAKEEEQQIPKNMVENVQSKSPSPAESLDQVAESSNQSQVAPEQQIPPDKLEQTPLTCLPLLLPSFTWGPSVRRRAPEIDEATVGTRPSHTTTISQTVREVGLFGERTDTMDKIVNTTWEDRSGLNLDHKDAKLDKSMLTGTSQESCPGPAEQSNMGSKMREASAAEMAGALLEQTNIVNANIAVNSSLAALAKQGRREVQEDCRCLPLSLPKFSWGPSVEPDRDGPKVNEVVLVESAEELPVSDMQGEITCRSEQGERIKLVNGADRESVTGLLDQTGVLQASPNLDGQGPVKTAKNSCLPLPFTRYSESSSEIRSENLDVIAVLEEHHEEISAEDAITLQIASRHEEGSLGKGSCSCLPELQLPVLSWGTSFPNYHVPLSLVGVEVHETLVGSRRPQEIVYDGIDLKEKGVLHTSSSWRTLVGSSEEITKHLLLTEASLQDDSSKGNEIREGLIAGGSEIPDAVQENLARDDKEKATCNCLALALPAVNWGFSLKRIDEGGSSHVISSVAENFDEELSGPSGVTTKKVTTESHIEGRITTTTKVSFSKDSGSGEDEENEPVEVDRHVSLFEVDIKDGQLTRVEEESIEPRHPIQRSALSNDPYSSPNSPHIIDESKLPRTECHAQASEPGVSGQLLPKQPAVALQSEELFEICEVDTSACVTAEKRPTPVVARITPSGEVKDGAETTKPVKVGCEPKLEEAPDEAELKQRELRGVVCNCLPLSVPTTSWFWPLRRSNFGDEGDLRRPLLEGPSRETYGSDRADDSPISTKAASSTVVTVDNIETRVTVEDGIVSSETLVQAVNVGLRSTTPANGGPEFLKSVVYGGLDVTLVSLGVISSSAGADAKTNTVLAMGAANVLFGFITFLHNVLSLYQDNREQFRLLVGKSLQLNGTLALLSFMFFGALAPITYGFSFRHAENRDYKFAATCLVALISIVLLGAAKARVTSKSAFTIISTLVGTGFIAAIAGYEAGDYVALLLERLGFDSV